jgi:DoxX-like protein
MEGIGMSVWISERTRVIAYWVTTLLGPASFVVGGTLFLTQGEQQVATLAHLGYPAYLLYILGFWKWLGAVAIVAPGLSLLKEWAYAGFFFELTGAAASHAFAGDGIGPIATPLVFLALVMASWALRPANRRIAGAA